MDAAHSVGMPQLLLRHLQQATGGKPSLQLPLISTCRCVFGRETASSGFSSCFRWHLQQSIGGKPSLQLLRKHLQKQFAAPPATVTQFMQNLFNRNFFEFVIDAFGGRPYNRNRK
ncbi:hypothetical protein SD70_27850 [Gordoniibacillus kamchatkensis]|uniref:Uncharacterized protein n=1 Tax=Gordoniibacillus kamchatkensis TaxID=1590651 RepID=A0ABR5AAZ0_9BACL|nr:hypothetical protein SD70_27850 [Paenibacillus sp. VKM B-2647]